MWLANLLRGFVILYLKFLLCIAALLILLGYINLCWQAVKASPSALFELLLFWAVASIAAYYIRESRRPRRERQESRRGAERTPLLPQDGGDRC